MTIVIIILIVAIIIILITKESFWGTKKEASLV